jgi:predicted Zn-dependent protease with MMP-like domain
VDEAAGRGTEPGTGRVLGRARRARRDRRGRGLRGPLAPPHLPLSRTPAERFDDLVLDAVEHLEEHWSGELSKLEFAVEDVPPPEALAEDIVPLSRVIPAVPGSPARVVVYRRPVEARAVDPADLADLVLEVVVTEVARELGVDPDVLDPPDDDD